MVSVFFSDTESPAASIAVTMTVIILARPSADVVTIPASSAHSMPQTAPRTHAVVYTTIIPTSALYCCTEVLIVQFDIGGERCTGSYLICTWCASIALSKVLPGCRRVYFLHAVFRAPLLLPTSIRGRVYPQPCLSRMVQHSHNVLQKVYVYIVTHQATFEPHSETGSTSLTALYYRLITHPGYSVVTECEKCILLRSPPVVSYYVDHLWVSFPRK